MVSQASWRVMERQLSHLLRGMQSRVLYRVIPGAPAEKRDAISVFEDCFDPHRVCIYKWSASFTSGAPEFSGMPTPFVSSFGSKNSSPILCTSNALCTCVHSYLYASYSLHCHIELLHLHCFPLSACFLCSSVGGLTSHRAVSEICTGIFEQAF